MSARRPTKDELKEAVTTLHLCRVCEERVQTLITERLLAFERLLVESGRLPKGYPPEPPEGQQRAAHDGGLTPASPTGERVMGVGRDAPGHDHTRLFQ